MDYTLHKHCLCEFDINPVLHFIEDGQSFGHTFRQMISVSVVRVGFCCKLHNFYQLQRSLR